MRPYTKNTYGRNHYFKGPKEHKVPKSSKDRRGTKTAIRHTLQEQMKEEFNYDC